MNVRLKQRSLKLLLACTSVVMTLVCLEFFLLYLNVPDQHVPFSWVTEDHPSSVYNMSPSVIWEHIPEKDITIYFTHATQHHKTDKYGMRVFSQYAQTYPNPSSTPIVLAGDSYTYGDIVNNTETSAYYLQQQLTEHGYNSYYVINAGVSGYGPDQVYRLLTYKILPMHPDSIVIWGLAHNDRYDSAERTLVLANNNTVYTFPGFIHGMYWAGVVHRNVLKHFPRSKVLQYIVVGLIRINPLGQFYKGTTTEYIHKLTMMSRNLEQTGATVVMSIVPNLGYLSFNSEYIDYQNEVRLLRSLKSTVSYLLDSNQYIEENAEKTQLPERLFLTREQDETMPYPAIHLSAKGNKEYASILIHYLQEQGLIKRR